MSRLEDIIAHPKREPHQYHHYREDENNSSNTTIYRERFDNSTANGFAVLFISNTIVKGIGSGRIGGFTR